MSSSIFRAGSRGFAALAGAFLMLAAAAIPAQAQALLADVHLGMAVQELQAAHPALKRVARPERMANGARGLWRETGVAFDAGLVFDCTYFVRGAEVDRIDLALTGGTEGPAAAFERIVSLLRERHGGELRAHGSTGSMLDETASWADGDEDVAVYLTGAPDAAHIHVVYKQRELKDGSTL